MYSEGRNHPSESNKKKGDFFLTGSGLRGMNISNTNNFDIIYNTNKFNGIMNERVNSFIKNTSSDDKLY